MERTLSWITRHRRTVRDYARLGAHHETCIYWSMIIVMTHRLARQPSLARGLGNSIRSVRALKGTPHRRSAGRRS